MNNLELVKSYFEALKNGKIEEAFSFFADNVKWHQPGNNKFSGIKNGISEISVMLGGMMEDTSGNFAVIPNGSIMKNADLVAVPVKFSGKKENGKVIDMTGIDLFEVIGGKIKKVWLFSDNQDIEDDFWGK